jgi:hypothetical protein
MSLSNMDIWKFRIKIVARDSALGARLVPGSLSGVSRRAGGLPQGVRLAAAESRIGIH